MSFYVHIVIHRKILLQIICVTKQILTKSQGSGTEAAKQDGQPGQPELWGEEHENTSQAGGRRNAGCARHGAPAAATRMSAPMRAARVWWAMTLLVGLAGCAGMQFPSTADSPMVHASDAARECKATFETASSPDVSPKLERTARVAAGALKGALLGAAGGAGIGLLFAAAYPAGCVEPTTCAAYVGGMVTFNAIAFGVVGAARGARTAWREASGVARDVHACNTAPET